MSYLFLFIHSFIPKWDSSGILYFSGFTDTTYSVLPVLLA